MPKTILIADDDSELVRALSMRCEALGLHVVTAYDALDAFNLIHECEPDIICLDVNMPCGGGLGVAELLTRDEYLAGIPIIIMTGDAQQETIRKCHDLCLYYVQKCSDVWPRIESVVNEVMDGWRKQVRQVADGLSTMSFRDRQADPPRPKPEEQATDGEGAACPLDDVPEEETACAKREEPDRSGAGRAELVEVVFEMLGADPDFLQPRAGRESNDVPWVLCIDDDADYSNALKRRLERYGIAVIRAFEGMEGVRFAFTKPADVILLDFELPNGQGDYVLRRLKENVVTRDIPVIMITGKRDRALERRALGMGVAKFMNKPPDFQELLQELRRHIDVLPREVAASSG